MNRIWLATLVCAALASVVRAELRAGAAKVDITPQKFPVIVNAMFTERSATRATDPLHARALVLDDGRTRIAIVVADSCMMPRDLLDEAKALASRATGIPTERILISSTHTHSAPSAMGCLGSRADLDYAKFLPPKLAEAIEQANKNLAPARVGWTVVPAPEFTHNRRWIRRPDRLLTDPFGEPTVRANMHPGHESADVVGPSGPIDPDLSLLSVQTRGGRPLALLANFSMHYYDSPLLSADYYGCFCQKIGELLGTDERFVGIMSQGTSGDLMWMDYGAPRKEIGYRAYADALVKLAADGCQKINYRDNVPLAMAERKLTLNFRVPDEKRLAWARDIVAKLDDRLPQTQPEIYAREATHLHERPTAELKLQAIRIGDLSIAAIPNEVFAITGLKIKTQSPLAQTFTIELANGAEGYIPPPEQHKFGGYTTWPARTAGLEVDAEPKILETVLGLLEEVAGKSRRKVVEPNGAYAKAVLASKPAAYWRFGDFNGPLAKDATGRHDGVFEDGVAFYLEGFEATSRAAHFAGGRMKADLPKMGDRYSVELWFWNGLPNDVRLVTGYIFSRGPDGDKDATGDHLGIGGTFGNLQGKLIFFNGNKLNQVLAGETTIEPKTWNHAVLVRDSKRVAVYLNGSTAPDLAGESEVSDGVLDPQLFIGGRNDNFANFEGKIDDVALYPRALAPDEIARHFAASGRAPPPRTIVARPSPLSPAEALASIRVADGLRVELVASEPEVVDPVEIAFDEDGRLWVVEMCDYPNAPPAGQPPRGRIKVLEDRDGDGYYEHATVFADGLLFAQGLMPWRGGVIVTAAPQILFLRDTDGDGRADTREVLYEGFTAANPQLRVSHPTLGLDNWIYAASGTQGGQVRRFGVADAKRVNLSGSDFRFDLLREHYEAVSGMGQYGLTFDDWGNRFVCTNRNHIIPIVMPARYLRRNPFLAPPEPSRDDQGIGGAARTFPISHNVTSSPLHAGTFSAACSVAVYRGALLPKEYRGSVFTCDPTGNLVHREILSPDGAGWRWHPAQQGVEFLASTDDWFRPVNLAHGPDGALYVVDMQRAIIEHPEWLPNDKNPPNLRAGDDRGRIYRIVPANFRGKSARPRLSRATSAELVAQLENPDGWWQMTAHRLLLERQDRAALAPLRKLVLSSRDPLARAHAAWLLEGLNALDADFTLKLLADKSPRVREQAVQLAERWLTESPAIQQRLLSLADDPDARVRWQVALSLGEWDDDRILAPLAKIAAAGAEDRWTRMAVASAVPQRSGALIAELAHSSPSFRALPPLAQQTLLRDFATIAGARRDADEIAALLRAANEPRWQMACLEGLAEGMGRRGTQLGKWLESLPDAALRERVAAQLVQATAAATDERRAVAERVAATQLLAHASWESAAPVLENLLSGAHPPELKLAAARALAVHKQAAVAALLLKGWRGYTPVVRREVTELFFRQPERLNALLDEIEAGRVVAGDLDSIRVQQLIHHDRAEIQSRARKLLSGATEERQAVVERYKPALTLTGDARRGLAVFQKNCATCHRVGNVGVAVGPDISDTRTKTLDQLLQDILNPNAAIDTNYTNYIVTTKDGETWTGLIAAETDSGVTLRRAENQTETVLRADIVEIRSSGLSLMPEGLEKGITPQEMADILEFLKSGPLRR